MCGTGSRGGERDRGRIWNSECLRVLWDGMPSVEQLVLGNGQATDVPGVVSEQPLSECTGGLEHIPTTQPGSLEGILL